MASDRYAKAGVDIGIEAEFSEHARRLSLSTHGNCPWIIVSKDLAAQGIPVFRLNIERYPFLRACWISPVPEGTGTKDILATESRGWRNVAYDLFAMTGGDVTRKGGKRVVLSNVLKVRTLGKRGSPTNDAMRELMQGLRDVANEQGVVLLGGETSQLGPIIGSENPAALAKFTWAGFMLGIYKPWSIISGDTLRAGQVIVALGENGFRDNGISLVRKALRVKFGKKWWQNPLAEGRVSAAATPSTLYDKLLEETNGWTRTPRIPVQLIIHLTGGSFPSKLGKMIFPKGLSAVLDDLFDPPDVVCECAEWLNLTDEEAYHFWGCGQGALVVLQRTDVERFLALAAAHGIKAKVCGKITKKDKPAITIFSKFRSEREIPYEYGEN